MEGQAGKSSDGPVRASEPTCRVIPTDRWGAASADGPEFPGATGHPRGATDHFFQSRMITVSPDFSTTTFWRSFQPSSSIMAFGMVT